jgi:hypothetical protein
MTTTDLRPVASPEVGQLLTVRDRQWVVTDVGVPALDGGHGGHRQHLVDLSSVEDDGLGDELSVIWEIEPGTANLQTATLPQPQLDRFDNPERSDAFLDAGRWGAEDLARLLEAFATARVVPVHSEATDCFPDHFPPVEAHADHEWWEV